MPRSSPGLRVLSVIPPMTQLNTPYPSTAYLTGFLRSRGIDARQADLALALVLELLSPGGLRALRAEVESQPRARRIYFARICCMCWFRLRNELNIFWLFSSSDRSRMP